MSTDPLIDLHCGAHTYPDGTVGVHEVDFTVYPDEIVTVIGGNGAGKSTLLEHLNATLVPDDGHLQVVATVRNETTTQRTRTLRIRVRAGDTRTEQRQAVTVAANTERGVVFDFTDVQYDDFSGNGSLNSAWV